MEQETSTAQVPAQFPNLQILATSLTAFAQGMKSLDEKDLDAAQKHSTELDAQLWRATQKLNEQSEADKKKSDKPADAKPANQVAPTDPNLDAMVKNLAILSLELRAAILIPSGKIPEAEALFTQARKQETDLGYREPPAFIMPVAEQEAELLTAAGQTESAAKAWQKALEDRPNSGFPLYGLAKIAEKSGDVSKTTDAYTKFVTAWKNADLNSPKIEEAKAWLAAHPSTALASSSTVPAHRASLYQRQ
jgi:tetratricopeptide (TPR) repeat protein